MTCELYEGQKCVSIKFLARSPACGLLPRGAASAWPRRNGGAVWPARPEMLAWPCTPACPRRPGPSHQPRATRHAPRAPRLGGDGHRPVCSLPWREGLLDSLGVGVTTPRAPLLAKVWLTGREGGWQLQVEPWPCPSAAPSSFSLSIFCFSLLPTPNCLLFFLNF